MRRLLVLSFLFLLSLTAEARATTIVFAPLADLVQHADLILHGSVEKVETLNLASGGLPQIVTDVTFSVHRTLKGTTPGTRFTLRLIGGHWGGYVLKIPAQPVFEKGQEVVMILEYTGSNWALSGMAQGLFHVARNADGSKLAKRSLKGSPIAALRHPQEVMEKEVELELPLDELFTFIRDHR